ncbi:hypothetical protein F4083_12175 [Candidatus Poribacteria bacterium]|nr:hypothetical protein [Candidatus Poribacteria bacterium]MYF55421.1 hypothetical protein [Candidatus Poribacteria bacterium]MYI95053.1 hypothetical protein [Candidatus Poribacteria bacterium]
MNKYSRLITLAGGVLSLFSFAFPWGEDKTGVQLANITSSSNEVGFVLWIFAASWFIIILSIAFYSTLKEKVYKFFICLNSIVGLICFVVFFFAPRFDLGPIYDEVQYGAFLSALGFIIAIVGLMNFSKDESSRLIA